MASLRQDDWQYVSPTLLLDQRGREVHLVHGEPKLLQKKLEEALEEQHEKQIIESVLKREEVSEQEKDLINKFGIDFEATRKALRSKRTKRRSKHIITQLAAGAYPIGKRLRKIGVEAKACCPICRGAVDELGHRLWYCPGLKELRDKWLPVDLQNWAKAGGQTTLLAMACLGVLTETTPKASEEVTQKWQIKLGN